MKISWGFGITLTIIVFLLISFATIYFSFNQKVNLVRDDYYEQEVKYQQKIEIIKRTQELPEQLEIKVVDKNIYFQFPQLFNSKSIEGNILLYRPSDRDKDFLIKLDLDNNLFQSLPLNNLAPGLWKVQVDWNVEKIEYFNEKIIMVN